jgi:hypothetical protein
MQRNPMPCILMAKHNKTLQMKKLILSTLVLIACTAQAQNCNDFQDTTLYVVIPASQTAYGTPFYDDGGVSFRSKYDDPLGMGIDGSAVIADHVSSSYTGSNGATNFAGNIFYQGWSVTELDFSGVGFANIQIELDVNRVYTTSNPFRVNGAGENANVSGVSYTITPLNNGSHVVITGPINTIELHEHELAIDNLCTSEFTPTASGCDGFENGTLYEVIPPSQTAYGSSFTTNGDISFRAKYVDPLGMGFDGSAVVADHVASGYTGADGCTNFAGNIYYQGFAMTELDFTATGFASTQIEFDVNRDYSTVNPFRINGETETNLPAGVTCTITALTFGSHVVITGPVSTIELHEHELAIDNLCATENIANAVTESSKRLDVTVYPNPTSEYLNIDTSLPIDAIEITALDGQRFTAMFVSTTRLDLRNLAPGIYFVRVASGNKLAVRKIVKQ